MCKFDGSQWNKYGHADDNFWFGNLDDVSVLERNLNFEDMISTPNIKFYHNPTASKLTIDRQGDSFRISR